MSHEHYDNPLVSRYASKAMSALWSPQVRHATWRKLWVALAEAEHELGLPVSQSQIDELKSRLEDIDFAAAARYEKELRHDVMAHVHAWGDQCPSARPIIHLGATSCYVTDNADLILMRQGMELLRDKLVATIDRLSKFAVEYKDLPCLGYTHLQPAQPTTVGKRATLWCYDLVLDLEDLEHRIENLRFRGAKGTTGTQATFLTLFNGDHAKVEELDRRVAEKMGFAQRCAVTGQTYTRKLDVQILDVLDGIAQSAHKTGTDLRILQSNKEIEEPFEKQQIGSSAMAYKRNPMRSERMCSLSRFVSSVTASIGQTVATQWMERTLDDSAVRRLSIPQAFLATDAILILYRNVVDGLVVYPKVITQRLAAELPFMATEEILMEGVRAGGDRQDLHERVRIHSHEAARQVKEHGLPNDLIERLKGDAAFAKVDLGAALDARRFVGRAPEQVEQFVSEIITLIRQRYQSTLGLAAEELKV
ncbi:adenylosuccinate lyase [Planctopirus limnophila DSM 3776]|uniref:Adenylosuccinate lyase n=1 Tax=Planctopirus limnophila (strain ATCC 43296 / DSM 3776 / IFAM 1008 / Mu 290) TaxID=521674 RepID=D5SX21_PLAL2|nr:adenylosuccinate lyase [Planctopirus limnophila]ADG69643.1 adenylosuccinate lyase [Planctopirus limnophila DSM 3776]